MKKAIYLIIIFLISISITSCEFEIDFNDKLPKDKLVVTSFIEADSTIVLKISKSARPGTYNYDYDITNSYVLNARAELFINDVLIETTNTPYDNNLYKFNYIPTQNDRIEIRISYMDFDTVIGYANPNITPPIVNSQNIFIRKDSTEFGIYPNIYLEVEIQGGENDEYYRMDGDFVLKYKENNIWFEEEVKIEGLSLEWENTPGVYYSKEASSTNPSDGENNYRVFSNKLFKNKTYKARFKVNSQSIYLNEYIESESFKGELKISKIEKQIFDYLYTLNKVSSGFSFSAEPVIIINGVENGFGFIGGKKTNRIVIDTSN